MRLRVERSILSGGATVPGSKSHTIRGLLLGALAEGTSVLRRPLRSSDTSSCVDACTALGARIDMTTDDAWRITGTDGAPRAAEHTVDVGNSGTTLFLAMSVAALAGGDTEFTGDAQIRSRSATPLLDALRTLGARAEARGENGCAPLLVGGGLHGGHVTIECPTSQYLSSLLIGCPLAQGDTAIDVPLLNEEPYVRMTLAWLDRVGARYEAPPDLRHVEVAGGQSYRAFDCAVPGDFSSATFLLAAAAVTRSRIFLRGLDMQDVQGDKAVVGMLAQMGCEVATEPDGVWISGPDELQGGEFDLNATPDALPAMAVVGAVARGETRLVNVAQARLKETDRIAVTARELARMGADVQERPDGLVVKGSNLHGAEVHGYGDHRMVMALAVAGLAADGETVIDTAESVDVTFPDFVALMSQIGAGMSRLP